MKNVTTGFPEIQKLYVPVRSSISTAADAMAIQGRQKMEVEKLFVKIHLYDILDDAK
jgi:hypothetical protein